MGLPKSNKNCGATWLIENPDKHRLNLSFGLFLFNSALEVGFKAPVGRLLGHSPDQAGSFAIDAEIGFDGLFPAESIGHGV